MCDNEKKLVEDLKEGAIDIAFTLSIAISSIHQVRKSIAQSLGNSNLIKNTKVFDPYCKTVNT